MLFSQPRVADFLNTAFEPVWVSVRPVPIIRIDFGDGNVLTRTLHGNILTSVCTADGQVIDALPGIYTEDVYRARLNELRLLARYVQTKAPEARDAAVKAYHQRSAEALARGEPAVAVAANRAEAPIGKGKIERPVERVIAGRATPPPAPAPGVPLRGEDLAGWKALVEDTNLNETTRRRQIHELLAKEGLVAPDRVLRPIYRDVLHADLDDPYLGLGKVLGTNYPFAGEDAARR